jgi:signal transduction histidine kinase
VVEAVTNVVRHSAAKNVRVELAHGSQELVVTVTDDGGAADAWAFGVGLTGMRERVEALGGALTTDGAGGFAVHATIPS